MEQQTVLSATGGRCTPLETKCELKTGAKLISFELESESDSESLMQATGFGVGVELDLESEWSHGLL